MAPKASALTSNSGKLIGVAGLPGSGKSTFFARPDFAEFFQRDDIGTNWRHNERRVCEELKNGKSAIVSDIEFCNEQKRNDFEKKMERKVEWVFFENAPWRCALNCLFRYYVQYNSRIDPFTVKFVRSSVCHKYITHLPIIVRS
jgi:hypothetical protein